MNNSVKISLSILNDGMILNEKLHLHYYNVFFINISKNIFM